MGTMQHGHITWDIQYLLRYCHGSKTKTQKKMRMNISLGNGLTLQYNKY